MGWKPIDGGGKILEKRSCSLSSTRVAHGFLWEGNAATMESRDARFGRTEWLVIGPHRVVSPVGVCVFRKALVSGINWSREGSGYLRELTCSSRPTYLALSSSSPGLLSLSIAPSVRLGVQGNIGTTLYQSMSHSPPYPSLRSMPLLASPPTHDRALCRGYDIIQPRSSWLLPAFFLIPEHLSTRINLVFSSFLSPPPPVRVHLTRSRGSKKVLSDYIRR